MATIKANESLLLSALNGDFKGTCSALADGADVNCADAVTKNSPLHLAACRNRFRICKYLLQHDAKVDSRNGKGVTALFITAQQAFFDVARLLLENKADANIATPCGISPLNVAVIGSHKTIISLLIAHGASVNADPGASVNADPGASVNADPGASVNADPGASVKADPGASVKADPGASVKADPGASVKADPGASVKADPGASVKADPGASVKADPGASVKADPGASVKADPGASVKADPGASVKADPGASVKADPGASVKADPGASVKADLGASVKADPGASVNADPRAESSPLFVALSTGHKGIIQLLIEKGADVNQLNRNNFSPLMLATVYELTELVTLFLRHGANSNVSDENGFTALLLAAEMGNEHIVKKLLKKEVTPKADVNATNKMGMTPLFISAFMGHFEVVKILTCNGAKVNIPSGKGLTPLAAATSAGFLNIVKYLLKNFADPNITVPETKNGPLHIATRIRREDMVKVLIENGASVNDVNAEKESPLHLACQLTIRKNEIARLLLANGAVVDSPEFERSPLEVSCLGGHWETAQMLAERRCSRHPTSESLTLKELRKAMDVQATRVDRLRRIKMHVDMYRDDLAMSRTEDEKQLNSRLKLVFEQMFDEQLKLVLNNDP